jgi:hypothetical protein
MMRSDMPKQVQAYRNGGGLMSLATVPMETEMAGQPHRLAYINPEEEQLLLAMGGAGEPGPGGIVSYFLHNQESRDKIKSAISKAFGGGGSSNNNTQSQNSDDNDKPSNNIGIVDSLLMGFGLKEKTDAYYNATARSIARSQGSDRAQQYLDNNADNISNQSNITVNVTEEADKFYDDTPSGGGDDNVSVAVATGGGGGGGEDVTTTTNVFEGLTDDQLNAQSDYLSRVADYMGTFTPEQLSDVGQRRGIYDQDFAPTQKEFMAITGADENLAKALLSRQPGQSYDLRNWSKIMESDNPLEAARAATAALYMTEGLYGAGRTIHTGQMVDAVDNVIGETDQLYAYTTGFNPYSQYGVGDIKIGIKTPDGVQLTQMGSLSSPTLGENLARFGYGTEDLAELIPSIEQYYADNFKYVPNYAKVGTYNDEFYSDDGVNFQTAQDAMDAYNQYYGEEYPIMGMNNGVMYGNRNILTNPASDPFGYIKNLQNIQQTTTGDLETGQGYLFQTTPGFFGNSALNIIDQDVYEANEAAAAAAAQQQAAAEQAAQYSSGQPITGSAAQNTGLQTYSALVPSAGTSTAGIAGLPSTIQPAIQTPYTFTAYNPGTYNPVVGPLTLPPLG